MKFLNHPAMARKLSSGAVALLFAIGHGQLHSQELLTGDTRLACEAVLCLASGTRPSECTPALQRYFSISFKKFSDTLRGRTDFLNLCPSSKQSPEMQALVNAQVNGAGMCDAQSLNASLSSASNNETRQIVVSNVMPAYCVNYTSNAYTDFKGKLPRYVGLPERGGLWAEPANYESALAAYKARVKAEDEAAAAAAIANGHGGR
jgi:hypothetical protein